MSGWNVLHITTDMDLVEAINSNPSIFGGGAK
jgi:hypothetical protein